MITVFAVLVLIVVGTGIGMILAITAHQADELMRRLLK